MCIYIVYIYTPTMYMYMKINASWGGSVHSYNFKESTIAQIHIHCTLLVLRTYSGELCMECFRHPHLLETVYDCRLVD